MFNNACNGDLNAHKIAPHATYEGCLIVWSGYDVHATHSDPRKPSHVEIEFNASDRESRSCSNRNIL